MIVYLTLLGTHLISLIGVLLNEFDRKMSFSYLLSNEITANWGNNKLCIIFLENELLHYGRCHIQSIY